jgi:NAD(P)-dependent dehydrogenase (short-subunit alcohol dehydrogenase family)
VPLDRVCLVTGASRGIGRATAERLERDGWRVETAERSSGVDLVDPEAARAAVARLDRLDGLVCNAGLIVRTSLLEHSLEDWDRQIAVNLTSVFVLCQAAARLMVAQGSGGSIVLVGSLRSLIGATEAAGYAASKGGVLLLAKSLSNELAGAGIRANLVAPGWIETEMTGDLDADVKREIDARIPAGRWGEPEDVAAAVAWLLSDDAAYVTGAVIPVDGGYLAR